jgi:pilus assembly protein Flp/PilA
MRRYLQSREGGAAAEYALILAIICSAIAGAALLLGGAVSASIDNSASTIASATSPSNPTNPSNNQPTGPGNCNSHGNCNPNPGTPGGGKNH